MTRDEAINRLESLIKWGNLYEIDVDACKMAIEALKQETRTDAISRQEALKLFATNDGKYLYEAIRGLPSVTPTVTEFADKCRECGKQRTGHWINAKRPFNFRFKCSECGRPALKSERNGNDVKSKYCPRCGARMESKATSGESYEGEFEAMEHNGRMDAVESDND